MKRVRGTSFDITMLTRVSVQLNSAQSNGGGSEGAIGLGRTVIDALPVAVRFLTRRDEARIDGSDRAGSRLTARRNA